VHVLLAVPGADWARDWARCAVVLGREQQVRVRIAGLGLGATAGRDVTE